MSVKRWDDFDQNKGTPTHCAIYATHFKNGKPRKHPKPVYAGRIPSNLQFKADKTTPTKQEESP